MDEHDDQVKARIFNRIFNGGPCSKDFLDCLAKKALASGNDRLLTEVSTRKADIDELEAEEKKDDEVTTAYVVLETLRR